MMKKIFLYKYLFIIFVLCSFFLSFAKESLAVAPCGGFPNCGGTCNSPRVCGTNWNTDSCVCYIPIEPTATTAPACRTEGQSCASVTCCNSQGLFCNSARICVKPATPTPTPIPCRPLGNPCDINNPCCSPNNCSGSYGGTCKPPLPTNTPTPTCKNLGQSCYNGAPCCSGNTCSSGYCVDNCNGGQLGYDYCLNFCEKGYPDGGWANIGCWANQGCAIPPTYDSATFPWPHQYVGTRYCPANTSDPVCHPVTCYNAPNATYCPSFYPAGSPCFGAGSCDNCGGPDCGWCGGVPPGGGVTPIPCNENCLTDARYATTCYNASFGICSNTQSCYGGKPNACPCAANTCVGQTCAGTCGDSCNGTKSTSNPDTPVLFAPANGAVVNVGTLVNLDWNAISNWGDGCPNSNTYEVCVESGGTCNLVNATGISSSTTARNWMPATSGYTATWKVRSNNGSKTATSLTRTIRVNSPPILVSLNLKNVLGTPVSVEAAGNRNQICQTAFSNSRQVTYEAVIRDPDGANDLNPAVGATSTLRFSRDVVLSIGPAINTTDRLATVTIDHPLSDNNSAVYPLFVDVRDIYGATNNFGLANRSWKVWNCQVPVLGTLYDDSSQSTICSGNWSNLSKLSGDAGFNALKFTNTASPYPSVVMSPNAPADYSSASGSGLIWGKSYISVFNNGSYLTPDNPLGNLLASGINTKIADLGTGTNSCPFSQAFNIGNLVSPYSTNPSAQIDFSFIQDQKAWYQVEGAGVKSAGPLSYGVPVTASVASRFLTLGNSTVYNGLVSATSFTNNNGNNNKDDLGGPGLPEPYKNWYVLKNTNDLDIYNYNYFYNNFYVKTGVGVTGTDWLVKPENGIYLVKGSLNITSDFVLADTTKTMMVIVNGDINIDKGVNRLDGIYIANGSISAGGDSATALTINGMLYARGSVILNRSFSDKTVNNTAPAVKVNYSPGLIFNLDPKILRVLSGWREE